jgi:hypothetical protein
LARTEILPAWALGKLESPVAGEERTAFSLALADKDMWLGERDFSAVDAAFG